MLYTVFCAAAIAFNSPSMIVQQSVVRMRAVFDMRAVFEPLSYARIPYRSNNSQY